MTVSLVPHKDIPAMSLCSICPEPGHCCKSFYLYTERDHVEVTVWKDELEAKARTYAPFVPTVEETFISETPTLMSYGREYCRVRWSCPKLQEDGRCGIYTDRPDVCRRFVPGHDSNSTLCVFSQLLEK